MDVIQYVRPRLPGDLVAVEFDQNYCRDAITYLAGSGAERDIPQFAVLGIVADGAATVTPGAAISASGDPPGDGAMGTWTVDAGGQNGRYWLTIIAAAVDGGTFEITRPDGVVDGTGIVGRAYDGMINGTLADGATDFVVGDRIPIDVAYAAVGKYVQIDFAATDGSQNAAGIAPSAVTVPDGTDLDDAAWVRGPMIVRQEELIWPAGATSDQKAAAMAQLQVLGILCRASG